MGQSALRDRRTQFRSYCGWWDLCRPA